MTHAENADNINEAVMITSARIRWALGLLTGAIVLTLAAGCQQGMKKHGDDFADEMEIRDLHRVMDAQVARAAREDGTLRSYHFNGVELNTLGEDRLDLMLHDTGAYVPLVVYLDVPSTNLPGTRQSVANFLKERGVREDQITLETGPNPNVTSPAFPTPQPWEQQSQPLNSSGPSVSTPMTGQSSSPQNH
jgi:hypothetical protein